MLRDRAALLINLSVRDRSRMGVKTKSYSRQYNALWVELEQVLKQTIFNDAPVLGDALRRFEEALASYFEVQYAVGVGSGTDALILLLRELGLSSHDEVVTCAHTFGGVVSAVLQSGARPVLVDPEPGSLVLTAAAAEGAITGQTRAVLAVHLYGHPAELDGLRSLCDRHRLLLIEDAAQAHGARFEGRPVGGFGAGAALSFHPSKNLGAFGDGGAILTHDAELATRLRVGRNLGKHGKYEILRLGPNSKLDTIQAAILDVKIRHLDAWLSHRRRLAQIYLRQLSGVGDLVMPPEDSRIEPAWHLFVIRTRSRDLLRDRLGAQGIRAGIHYPVAAHLQRGLAAHLDGASFPIAKDYADTVLSLPLSHEHSIEEIHEVAEAVRAFYGG